MTFWEAVVLGMIQGATEFLPVSSSGHLVVAQELLHVSVPGVVFEVVLHLATLVSILLVYRGRVWQLMTGSLRGDRESLSYVGLLAVASVPAGAVGILFRDGVEAVFDHPAVAGVAFLATGAILWTTRGALRREPRADPGLRTAAVMGLAQAFALIPGISRSGVTVVAALWGGVAPREAAAFSFLMALPAIAGAALLLVPELEAAGVAVGPLVAGSVAAAVTGVVAIQTFVRLLQRQSFHRFSYYLWALGLAFLGFLFLLP